MKINIGEHPSGWFAYLEEDNRVIGVGSTPRKAVERLLANVEQILPGVFGAGLKDRVEGSPPVEVGEDADA